MATKSGVKSLAAALLLLGALHSMSACVPLPLALIAATTVTAVDVDSDRRTPGRYVDDNALEVKLRGAITKDEALGRNINVSVTVVNGIVLLTGEVNTDAQRRGAGELAQGYEETRKVVNELSLAGETNITSRFNDALLTTKVKFRLRKSPGVAASDVKVVTEHSKVYLMGLVTEAEAEAAVEAIRTVKGVTHIVKVFEYIDPSSIRDDNAGEQDASAVDSPTPSRK